MKRYETTHSAKLGKLIVSWMVVKFVQMGWEMPDLVVPGIKEEVVFYKANSLNKRLAKLFAKMLDIPYIDLFTYTLSNTVYDEQGRLQGSIKLKNKTCLHGKKVLIIQDHLTSLMQEYAMLQHRHYLLAFLSAKALS